MVELLIPAQNKKSVEASLGYADAVYFGVETFNMRIHAKNIRREEMRDFVSFCHDNKIKAYLTTNIIIYEGEIDLLRALIAQANEAEVDAIIVHDFAAIQLAKEHKMPFHISTQVSISNSSAARFYEKLGAERIIMARELSLQQIAEIASKLRSTKVEAFVHGAMCTSISGRCYFSQVICDSPDFSANRGRCLQPCRKEWKVFSADGKEFDYDGYFFINAKDLCMIEYIPELIEAKISSFKVEGRMRSPRYIETVSRLYRRAIDEYFNGTFSKEKAVEWKKELETVYNRGFSTGFYFRKPTALDINRQKSGNLSEVVKTEVGRVLTYYSKNKVAKIVLREGKYKVGDTLYIEGSERGFVKCVLTEMKHKNRLITETPHIPREREGYVLTIKIKKPVKKGHKIFVYTSAAS
ncbi:MAG: peptidase U32 family protein [Candidatus Ranarchaeia archaeon]